MPRADAAADRGTTRRADDATSACGTGRCGRRRLTRRGICDVACGAATHRARRDVGGDATSAGSGVGRDATSTRTRHRPDATSAGTRRER
ncbi:hypothetical protein STTU_1676 [Streptomyces sp. Tu6071]|nr:hypothetical protein STTU_1676 [Streptomyces sp. Tu6071]